LKKLTVHWFTAYYCVWDYSSDPHSHDYIPLLDDAVPPYGRCPGEFAITLDDVKTKEFQPVVLPLSGAKLTQLEDGIRRSLNLEDDAILDYTDDAIIMRAWEARHRHRVARQVRAIAEACPLLEEFEWYLVDDKQECETYMAVRWMWKIKRDETGQIKLISGDLAWTTCVHGDPPRLYILVGDELQRALTMGKGSLNRYYRAVY
jgi:hypothetical protein